MIGAFCLSEPEAGSDATLQNTTAIDKGDHYLLNGVKNWITNGKYADIYLIIAQTHPEKGHRGINALIVEAGTEGLTTGEKEDKMGIRSSDRSEEHTSELQSRGHIVCRLRHDKKKKKI